MKFRDTRFWKNYGEYNRIVMNSSMRSTVDALIYWRLLNYFKFNKFLEIGIYQGLTTGLVFESNPSAHVTAIDPTDRLALFYKNYPDYQSQFTFIKQPSQQVGLGDNLYDFILIDGDHSYESVLDDILKCLPNLNHSGVLAIDDYKLPGVAKAIEYLYNLKTDWVPFLRSEQTEFWHHRSCNRESFLDSLFTDPISKFIFIKNVVDQHSNTICSATTLGIFTDQTEYFDMALQHYNI
jgi:predicted O-methyltransferase YrrM